MRRTIKSKTKTSEPEQNSDGGFEEEDIKEPARSKSRNQNNTNKSSKPEKSKEKEIVGSKIPEKQDTKKTTSKPKETKNSSNSQRKNGEQKATTKNPIINSVKEPEQTKKQPIKSSKTEENQYASFVQKIKKQISQQKLPEQQPKTTGRLKRSTIVITHPQQNPQKASKSPQAAPIKFPISPSKLPKQSPNIVFPQCFMLGQWLKSFDEIKFYFQKELASSKIPKSMLQISTHKTSRGVDGAYIKCNLCEARIEFKTVGGEFVVSVVKKVHSHQYTVAPEKDRSEGRRVPVEVKREENCGENTENAENGEMKKGKKEVSRKKKEAGKEETGEIKKVKDKEIKVEPAQQKSSKGKGKEQPFASQKMEPAQNQKPAKMQIEKPLNKVSVSTKNQQEPVKSSSRNKSTFPEPIAKKSVTEQKDSQHKEDDQKGNKSTLKTIFEKKKSVLQNSMSKPSLSGDFLTKTSPSNTYLAALNRKQGQSIYQAIKRAAKQSQLNKSTDKMEIEQPQKKPNIVIPSQKQPQTQKKITLNEYDNYSQSRDNNSRSLQVNWTQKREQAPEPKKSASRSKKSENKVLKKQVSFEDEEEINQIKSKVKRQKSKPKDQAKSRGKAFQESDDMMGEGEEEEIKKLKKKQSKKKQSHEKPSKSNKRQTNKKKQSDDMIDDDDFENFEEKDFYPQEEESEQQLHQNKNQKTFKEKGKKDQINEYGMQFEDQFPESNYDQEMGDIFQSSEGSALKNPKSKSQRSKSKDINNSDISEKDENGNSESDNSKINKKKSILQKKKKDKHNKPLPQQKKVDSNSEDGYFKMDIEDQGPEKIKKETEKTSNKNKQRDQDQSSQYHFKGFDQKQEEEQQEEPEEQVKKPAKKRSTGERKSRKKKEVQKNPDQNAEEELEKEQDQKPKSKPKKETKRQRKPKPKKENNEEEEQQEEVPNEQSEKQKKKPNPRSKKAPAAVKQKNMRTSFFEQDDNEQTPKPPSNEKVRTSKVKQTPQPQAQNTGAVTLKQKLQKLKSKITKVSTNAPTDPNPAQQGNPCGQSRIKTLLQKLKSKLPANERLSRVGQIEMAESSVSNNSFMRPPPPPRRPNMYANNEQTQNIYLEDGDKQMKDTNANKFNKEKNFLEPEDRQDSIINGLTKSIVSNVNKPVQNSKLKNRLDKLKTSLVQSKVKVGMADRDAGFFFNHKQPDPPTILRASQINSFLNKTGADNPQISIGNIPASMNLPIGASIPKVVTTLPSAPEKRSQKIQEILHSEKYEILMEEGQQPFSFYPDLIVAVSPLMKSNYAKYGDLLSFQVTGQAYHRFKLGTFSVFNSQRKPLLAGIALIWLQNVGAIRRTIQFFLHIQGHDPQTILTPYSSDLIEAVQSLIDECILSSAHVIDSSDVLNVLDLEISASERFSATKGRLTKSELFKKLISEKEREKAEDYLKKAEEMSSAPIIGGQLTNRRNVQSMLNMKHKTFFAWYPPKFVGVGLLNQKQFANKIGPSARFWQTNIEMMVREIVKFDKTLTYQRSPLEMFKDPIQRIFGSDEERIVKVKRSLETVVFRQFITNYAESINNTVVIEQTNLSDGTFKVTANGNVFTIQKWICSCKQQLKIGLPCRHILCGARKLPQFDYLSLIRQRWIYKQPQASANPPMQQLPAPLQNPTPVSTIPTLIARTIEARAQQQRLAMNFKETVIMKDMPKELGSLVIVDDIDELSEDEKWLRKG